MLEKNFYRVFISIFTLLALIILPTQPVFADSNDSERHRDKGLDYRKAGQYDEAISEFTTAIQLDPKNKYAYLNRGDTYYHLKKYEKALQDYNKLVELNPENCFPYLYRGYTYWAMGDIDKAEEDFTKSIKVYPNFANYSARAYMKYIKEDDQAAIEDFNKAFKVFEDSGMTITKNYDVGKAYYYRGLCYQALGDNTRAQADFKKAKELGYED